MATDHCNDNIGTFKVEVENIFCGAEGFTCAKGLKISFHEAEVTLMKGVDPTVAYGNAVYSLENGSVTVADELTGGQLTVYQERCGMFLKINYKSSGKINIFFFYKTRMPETDLR